MAYRFQAEAEAERRLAAALMAVLDGAVPPYALAHAGLFEEREVEFIRREQERHLREAQLPWGGARERKWARKLHAMARGLGWNEVAQMKARQAAKRWEAVDGHYYLRRPLSPRMDKTDYEWALALKEAANAARDWEKKWFAEMLLDGAPVAVANFRLDCRFMLQKPDGDVDRLVELTNDRGERTGLVPLSSEAFHAPTYMRRWCLNQGNFHWGVGNPGGAQELALEKLHADTGWAAAWRKVKLVCVYGWHAVRTQHAPEGVKMEGLWFFRDAVYTAAGELLQPDEHGVYSWQGESYLLGENGRENKFHQGHPRMYPGAKLSEARLELAHPPESTGDRELDILRAFYTEVCDRLRRTVGSLDAWLMVGSTLAYVAAPEIFELKHEFTGMWVHGSKESGKSTTSGWLMEFDGLHLGRQGINLRGTNSTPTGLAQALDQYSNIPVWADEFRFAEVGGDKISVLHQTYNRGGQTKFNPTMLHRETRTNFLISGESTTGDAALLGRYMHVQMSRERREKDAEGRLVPHEAWFENHRQHFFHFKRFLLERRPAFVELVLKILKSWSETPGIPERTKSAFGVPFASFVAMGQMLESHGGEDVAALKRHTVATAAAAAADVSAETNVNVFLGDMVTAWKAGDLDARSFRLRWKDLEHPPGAPGQGRWASYELLFDPGAVIAGVQMFLTRRHGTVALKQKDLRDQLSREPYWIAGLGAVRFNLTGSSSIAKAWGIRIDDLRPLGYQPVSNEAWEAFLMNRGTGEYTEDPRKGDMFAIVDALRAKELEKQRGQE